MIREHANDLAGVIVEPFQRLLPPAGGFLETLRRVTAELGIPLIFDEVVTGFRFAYGGAQALYGVTPDICTLGKIIGGGFPLAAIAGRAEIMKHFDKKIVGADRFLTQIGTLSGNPVAAAAGLASLAVLKRPGAYDGVYAAGKRLMEGFAETLKQTGLPAQVVGCPVMFDVVFAAGDIHDYRGTLRADTAMQARVNATMRAEGILKSEGKTYMSTAHTDADIAQMLGAFATAATREASRRAAAEQRTSGLEIDSMSSDLMALLSISTEAPSWPRSRSATCPRQRTAPSSCGRRNTAAAPRPKSATSLKIPSAPMRACGSAARLRNAAAASG
jgi:glutamate-1-semialdehyde 2,1-aminomutase